MSKFLKTLKRDLKKVNVERKQILKKDSVIPKTKKESSRKEKKSNAKDLER